jgi:hypothetical protein
MPCHAAPRALPQVTRWLTRYLRVPRLKVAAVLHLYPLDYSAAFDEGVRKYVAAQIQAAAAAEAAAAEEADGGGDEEGGGGGGGGEGGPAPSGGEPGGDGKQ